MAAGSNMLWYGGLSRRGVKLGLDNVEELLARLGRPQDSMRFIHVAGTDGKGSVCAMMESVLRESGYRVGAFTSPEILAVNECIRIDGIDIEDRDLEQVL
ncbi:MAG: bifunctional folylpolyglutamate synthase/dihydrofolate synthase, partial [Thermoplasmata archaeon]|nr:bifunctional folylpolyglutamate synthase/dihydrofolate synthase [Thermoplasmata archaeon]